MQRQFDLSDKEFEQLRTMVFRHTGIHLSEFKRDLVYSRFAKRMRILGIDSFSQYYQYVLTDSNSEIEQFSNVITTNLTSFFREAHHFEILAGKVIPKLLRKSERRIRIWSAGCSTGQEPYSIAITLLNSIPNINSWDVKILATDLNSKVLEVAKEGVYKKDQLKNVPESIIQEWFRSETEEENLETATINEQVRSLITFKRLNLMDTWPMRGPFDVIFCRNVVIYFNRDTKLKLFKRLASLQYPGALLFLGHSENVEYVTDDYAHIGKTVYEKKHKTLDSTHT